MFLAVKQIVELPAGWNAMMLVPSCRARKRGQANVILHHVLVEAGGRLNKKDGLTRYGDSHVKDKTS